MSENVPVTERFEDVDPDPDAVIDAYGAETIDDLIDGPGEHDPHPDPVIDGDVEAAADRLAELADITLDSTNAEPERAGREADGTETSDAGARYTAKSVGGGATVEVVPGDGETLESFLGLDEIDDAERTEERGHVLVGPDPAATSVSNETFGAAGGVGRTATGPTPSRSEPAERPDPAAIDPDAVTEREVELATSVFEWVS